MKYGIRATNWTNATLYDYYCLKSKKSTHFSEKIVLLPTEALRPKLVSFQAVGSFVMELGQFPQGFHFVKIQPLWLPGPWFKQRDSMP